MEMSRIPLIKTKSVFYKCVSFPKKRSKPLYPTTAVPGEVGGELSVVHSEHHEAKQEAGQHAQAPCAKVQPVKKSQ
jgi:hypothetical protein